MNMKKYLLIPLAALFLATGCATDEPPAPEVVPPRHTLIMYILDESRLHSSLTLNVEQVLSAVGTSFPESYSIYIYFDDIYKDPMLYRVVKPSKSGVQATLSTVKTYEKSFETASAANMKVVLQDVLDDEETPAETYGLLMSSHGLRLVAGR